MKPQECTNVSSMGRDCLARRARKLCDFCKRTDREDRLRDLQDELDDVMLELEGLEFNYGHSPADHNRTAHIDVANLFAEMVEMKFRAEVCWLENLAGVRIKTLRQFANYAAGFGLDQIVRIIRQHIAVRQGSR